MFSVAGLDSSHLRCLCTFKLPTLSLQLGCEVRWASAGSINYYGPLPQLVLERSKAGSLSGGAKRHEKLGPLTSTIPVLEPQQLTRCDHIKCRIINATAFQSFG